MSILLPQLESDRFDFPAVENALTEPDGLLAFGGDLSPTRLLRAYQHGIFPWFSPGDPILWWCPSQRAVVSPNAYTPSKSLKKCFRRHDWQVSINKATKQVIEQCAKTRPEEETWITQEMQLAYGQLVNEGHCHSVEVWLDGHLVGGLYGLLIGKVFCGESMFSLVSNSSKIAFWHLNLWMRDNGLELIDCQMMNPHLRSLGAIEISRREFLDLLLHLSQQAYEKSSTSPHWITHE